MRLGDLDALKAQLNKLPMMSNWGEAFIPRLIDEQPTIPAVPVVRCQECKHFNLITHECENELLSTDHEGGASYSLNFYDDDFCSYGELRETSHD